jgi:DNA-directed RNA polymerase specialized sigma24 family protein
MDDLELLQRYKNGDESAFTQLHDRYKRDVENVVRACRRLSSIDLSAAVSDGFYSLAKAAKTQDIRNPFTFASRAAVNAANYHLRNERRHDRMKWRLRRKTKRSAPDMQVMNTMIRDCIETLSPEDQRQIVSLLNRETHLEAQQSQGVSPTEIDLRRAEARANLQTLLA